MELTNDKVMMTLTMPYHELQDDGKPLVLSREDRIRLFGIDCSGPYGDGITFRGGEWSPGGEYVQVLKVKNVSMKLKKLKYKVPANKYFSLAFPELIVLSPGTSEDIQVVFRPLVSEVYEDTLYFKIEGMGERMGFHVPIRAYISTLQISIPPGLDFGLCPTAVVSKRTFYIQNTGQVPAPFSWKVPKPFRLNPAQGEVPVNEMVAITASLLPKDASVYVSQAICNVGEGVNAIKPNPVQTMKISAIGKYAHLAFSEPHVDFGDVYVGGVYKGREAKKEEGNKPAVMGSVVKEVVLYNRSMVEAHFNSRRLESDRDSVFTLSPTAGVIQPQDSLHISIIFTPKFAGTFSLDNFEYFTPGGSVAALGANGMAVSPDITLYKKEDPRNPGVGLPDSINFRDVKVGESSTRVLFLTNPSPLPAYYCFVNVLQEDGIFTFSQTRGIIPPQLDVHIKLMFTPVGPSNYYRRVFCLVENQYPLFVDLMGTGYVPARGDVKEQRPAPLRHAHVQAFRNRVAHGLGRLSPEELELMLQKEGPSDMFAKIGMGGTMALKTARVAKPVTRSGEATRSSVAVAQEFFEDPRAQDHEVIISNEELDFGYTSHNAVSEKKIFRVTNSTRSKVMVLWACPSDPDADGQLRQGAFEVVPDVIDIGPGKSFEFRVSFSPKQHSRYYCQQIEAYVFFKTQRTFRLVNDATLSPPWCFPVRVAGHTFAGDPFLSKVQFNVPERKLSFPACFVGDSVYQSLRITNRGNTPAFFQFASDTSGIFSVKPTSGLIPAEDFQIVAVRFRPNQKRIFKHKLKVSVNGHPNEVSLFGQGDTPKLEREGANMGEAFFLKPTCVGMAATNTLRLRNASRLPLILKFDLPASASGIMDVNPKIIRLRGNEVVNVNITFAPREQKAYKIRLTLKVRALAGNPPNNKDARQIGQAKPSPVLQTLTVPIIGPGSKGALDFNPEYLDFGVALVNTLTTRSLKVINQSDCDLAYELLYCLVSKEDRVGGNLEVQPIPQGAGGGNILTIDKPTGILPARSTTSTQVTFQPHRDGLYNAIITVRLSMVDENGRKVMHSDSEKKLLEMGNDARDDAAENVDADAVPDDLPLTCRFQGRASFPQLVFRDVCVEGGGLACAPMHLWKDLNLPEINKLMATPLTPEEVRFNLESSPDLSTLPRFPFPFIPNVLGQQAQAILLEVCNPGFLTTSFEIHLPNEKDIEMETWADENEPTEKELMMNAIIDNLKCFEIYPKHGTLEPGEALQLRISYSFSSMEYGGKHTLPIYFRVMQGKQYWLDLHGVTLDPIESYLHVPLGPPMEFELYPIAVGLPLGQAPFQTTEIFNTGLADMEYEIDVAPLEELWENNWGVRILELQNSGGTIFGQQPLLLKWKFFPLEPKEYKVKLKIVYTKGSRNAEKEFIVRAKGYDPRRDNPYKEPLPEINKGLVQPAAQIMEVTSQIGSISADRIFLGRISQRATCQRLLILRNQLMSAPIEYQWDTKNYPMIEIQPPSGTIQAGDFCMVRVIVLTEKTVPCVLNANIILELRELQVTQTSKGRKKAKSRIESRFSQTRGATNKLGKTSHNSVVAKTTRARTMNLAETRVKPGRTANLPCDHKKTLDTISISGAGPIAESTRGGLAESTRGGSMRLDEFMDKTNSVMSGTTGQKMTRFASEVTYGDGGKSSLLAGSVTSVVDAPPSFLYLSVHGEVVDEEWYINQGEEMRGTYLPRPRKFISGSPFKDAPALKPGETTTNEPPSHEEVNGFAREVLAHMFHEIMSTSEMIERLEELPQDPPIPYFRDIKSPPIGTRLIGVVATMNLQLGKRSPKDQLRLALQKTGCKRSAPGMQAVYKNLSVEPHELVTVQTYITTLPYNAQMEIDRAIAFQEAQILAKQRIDSIEEGQAAIKIQCLARRKFAKQEVDKKKRLTTVEGRKEDRAAIKIQAIQRRRAAQKKTEELVNTKLRTMALQTVKESDFQDICWKVLENTMFNLIQEACHSEFDLYAVPKHYVLAEELAP